jgi:hypothetical protein
MEVNVESMSLVYSTDNGLEDLLLFLIEVEVLHRLRYQRDRWE